jgi:hypothetical protein
VITNVSNSVQQVPEILLQAIDGNDQVIQTQKVRPKTLTLAPGKFIKFKGVMKKLPKTAKRLDIAYGSFVMDDSSKLTKKKINTTVKKNLKKIYKPEKNNN